MSDTTRENMERVAKNIHSLADPDTYWPRPGGRTAAATEAAAMLRALLDAKEAAERELEEWQRVRTGEGDRAMSERVTDFLVVGRWSQCAHCGGIYAGEHYCGAPWQQRAADCPAEWQPFVWDGKALLTRVSGEPPRTVGDTGDGGER